MKNKTEENVRASVSSIYSQLLSKRRAEKEMKEEQKRMEAELKENEAKDEEEIKLSKKEKRQKSLDNWKEIVIGLTGDDLEYTSKKSSKKKYRKWIDDDDIVSMMSKKPKKVKKKNYNKEFEPELNMLRTLVSEQNRFTADLQKRFQNAAGPAAKDAMMPNKTLVELASVIASGRSNSLGMIREIGNLKKSIADLYMKQKKLDADMGSGAKFDGGDVELMGSNIAASIFSDNSGFSTPINIGGGNTNESYNSYNTSNIVQYNPISNTNEEQARQVQPAAVPPQQQEGPVVSNFDPASWEGPDIGDSYTKYEAVPHTVIVQKNKETGDMRFVAIKDEDGSEFVGCPVPTSDISKLKVNENDMTVRGEFDEVYKLAYV